MCFEYEQLYRGWSGLLAAGNDVQGAEAWTRNHCSFGQLSAHSEHGSWLICQGTYIPLQMIVGDD